MASRRPSTPAGRSRTRARAAGTKPRQRAAHPHPAKRTLASRKPAAKAKTQKAKPKSPPRSPRAASAKPSNPRRSSSWSQRAVIGLMLGAVLAAGYFFYLRDSGLVAVDEVEVVGIEGPEREAVSAALSGAAASMTTLHVRTDELESAVAGFPTVAGIATDAHLPHGLTVTVTERPPVLALKAGGSTAVPVAADGRVLTGVDITGERLPVVRGGEVPARGRVSGEPLAAARVTGAAPRLLLPLISKVVAGDPENIEVELRGGIPVRFGDVTRAGEKWAAVAAVLADPRVDRVTAIDVRVPERPALGGAAPPPEVDVPETGVELAVPPPVEDSTTP